MREWNPEHAMDEAVMELNRARGAALDALGQWREGDRTCPDLRAEVVHRLARVIVRAGAATNIAQTIIDREFAEEPARG